MSDIKKGDLVIVIRNTSGKVEGDAYIGKIFEIRDIFSGAEGTRYLIHSFMFNHNCIEVSATREELKKIEPLSDDEIIEERELENVD